MMQRRLGTSEFACETFVSVRENVFMFVVLPFVKYVAAIQIIAVTTLFPKVDQNFCLKFYLIVTVSQALVPEKMSLVQYNADSLNPR